MTELNPGIIQFLALYVQFPNLGIAAVGTVSLTPPLIGALLLTL